MSRRLLTLLLAAILLLAACGDDDSDSTSGDSAPVSDESSVLMETDAIERDGDDMDAGRDDGTSDDASAIDDAAYDSEDSVTLNDGFFGETENTADFDSAQEEPQFPEDRPPAEVTALFVGRQIIKTGDIVVEAADVRATTNQVVDAVFENGGAIWGQETQSEPSPRTVLTIRVPPLDFDRLIAAVTRVPGLGVVSESTTSDDVTEVVVDLDARIIAAESAVQRIQDRLDEARDLNTIFQLEEELATRQANLERLRGQRKTIGDQVTLSTITLTIIELDPDRLQPEMEVVAWLGKNDDEACPGSSDLRIGADETAVLCVSISNTGEDTLTDVNVESSTFRFRVDDFAVVAGVASLDEVKPGDDLLLTIDLEADGGFINRVDASNGINIGVEATATPAGTETIELTGSDSVFISADVDDPLPGFGDSFSSGWNAMIAVVSVLMIVIGVLLPFIPIILLALWLGRKILIKQRERANERAIYVESYVAAQEAAQAQARAQAQAHQDPPPSSPA